MAIDSQRTEPRSRRAILAGAIGGLAAVVGSRFASPDRARGAAGDPLIIGNTTNNAGTSNTTLTTSSSGTGLLVTQNGTGTALRGSAVGAGSIAGFFTANNGTGVSGVTGAGGSYGVFAQNTGAAGSAGAMRANGGSNHGIVASTASDGRYAVSATGANGTAIYGTAIQVGVHGNGYRGVMGTTDSVGAAAGVLGLATGNSDVYGAFGYTNAATGNGRGVYGKSNAASGIGVYGEGTTGVHSQGNASVTGDLAITGAISKGSGTFKIDHPLDPANKFLYHSFVESPDMKNVYDGVATLDARGEATVRLPAYFDKLNRDVRYQLTAIGNAAPNLHVKTKAKGNAFSIGGGSAGQEVSWLLTGIRQDAFAKAHPVVAEVAKVGAEKGRYLHPTENGVAKSKGMKQP
jgi:hypothetical protein